MEDVILTSYKYLSDGDTVLTGYRVVEKMEDNPNFSDAPPALAETKKLLPEVLTAVNNAKGRDVEAVELKNNLKAELVGLLTELADYVTLKCKGDRLMLLSSGFPISGASSTQIDQVIQELEVAIGAPGEATYKRKAFTGCKGIYASVHCRAAYCRNGMAQRSRQASVVIRLAGLIRWRNTGFGL